MKHRLTAFLLCLIVIAAVLTGCSGSSEGPKYVEVSSLYGRDTMKLWISSPRIVFESKENQGFQSELTLDEMYDMIKQLVSEPNYCEKGSRGIFIRSPYSMNNELNECYYIMMCGADSKNELYYNYSFNNCSLDIVYQSDGSDMWVLFPLQCLIDEQYADFSTKLETDKEYEVSSGAEYFYDFYTKSGWLDVKTENENSILINSVKPELAQAVSTLQIPVSLRLSFRDEGEKHFVTISKA